MQSTGRPAERALEDLDEVALDIVRRAATAGPGERTRLRDELIAAALPFAARLARRYRGRGEPAEDLEQVARLGLVKSVLRYDPERGSFTAYAVVTICGELKRHFRDTTWGVHVPRRLQDLGLEIGTAAETLLAELSRRPTVTEIADRVGVADADVLTALESAAGYTPASLNAPVGEEAALELGDLMGSPDPDLEGVDDRVTIEQLLCRLPVRERRMLALRFYGNRTQSEIAAEFGISQMHVSRLLNRSLTWLRHAMMSDVPPRWEGAVALDPRAAHIRVTGSPAHAVLHLAGEIDRDNAPGLREELLASLRRSGRRSMRVDLAEVPFADAAGVGALLAAAEAARRAGIAYRITGATGFVAETLDAAGLGGLVEPGPVSRG